MKEADFRIVPLMGESDGDKHSAQMNEALLDAELELVAELLAGYTGFVSDDRDNIKLRREMGKKLPSETYSWGFKLLPELTLRVETDEDGVRRDMQYDPDSEPSAEELRAFNRNVFESFVLTDLFRDD